MGISCPLCLLFPSLSLCTTLLHHSSHVESLDPAAINADETGLLFDAFASTTLLVQEKQFLVWWDMLGCVGNIGCRGWSGDGWMSTCLPSAHSAGAWHGWPPWGLAHFIPALKQIGGPLHYWWWPPPWPLTGSERSCWAAACQAWEQCLAMWVCQLGMLFLPRGPFSIQSLPKGVREVMGHAEGICSWCWEVWRGQCGQCMADKRKGRVEQGTRKKRVVIVDTDKIFY